MRKMIVGSFILATLLMLVALAVPSGVYAQAASCTEGIDVGGFTVCFLGVTDNGDDTSTWTYSVTSDGNSATSAMSHWTLALCKQAALAHISPSGSYTTFSPYGDATGREGIVYDVEVGNDAILELFGIKFQDPTINLGENGAVETDIFQVTFEGQWPVTLVDVGIKAGTGEYYGSIPGPSCSPTAVTMSASPVAAQPNSGLLAVLAVAAAASFVTIAAVARQKRVTVQV